MLICEVLLLSNECVIVFGERLFKLYYFGLEEKMERKCYTIAEALRYMLLDKQKQHTEDLNNRARNCPQAYTHTFVQE